MKNIKIIKTGIDVSLLLEEINKNSNHWLDNTSRQTLCHVQRFTENILLVSGRRTETQAMCDSHIYEKNPIYKKFPIVTSFVNNLFPGRVARFLIVKLLPNAEIMPHTDEGAYYRARDRYHLSISGEYTYVVGDEEIIVQPGTLFWFDNQSMHSAKNNKNEDRIAVIFDVERIPDPPMA